MAEGCSSIRAWVILVGLHGGVRACVYESGGEAFRSMQPRQTSRRDVNSARRKEENLQGGGDRVG